MTGLVRTLQREEGGAMVETAISMLVIVPVIFYTLFLDDMLRYKLDQQETVVQAVWNLTVRDYHQGGNHAADVAWQDQMQYCDHSAAFDSYDESRDCDSDEHHKALSAHACWLYGSPNGQVSCGLADADLATDYGLPDLMGIASGFAGTYNAGGMFRCWGRTSVINSFMPQQLFTEFSDVDLSEKTKYADDPHGNAGGDVYVLPWDRTAILTDSWALNDRVDEEPNNDGNSDFYERMENVYSGGISYIGHVAATIAFFAMAYAKELINPMYPLIMGDNPAVPNLSVQHSALNNRPGVGNASPGAANGSHSVSEEGSGADYYSTPWKDWNNDEYEKTYNERGVFYMGCKNAETHDCLN